MHYDGRQFSFDYWLGVAITEEPTAECTLESLLIDAMVPDDFGQFCVRVWLRRG